MIDTAAWSLLGLAAVLLLVHRRQLAAIWFRTEDPRTVCLFRVLLGGLLFLYVQELSALEIYLFSEDGLITGERARDQYGHKHWSLLYSFDSPRAVTAYVWALRVSCIALAIGLATPVSKWLTLFLLLGLIARNNIFLAGEHVFASFLFGLCLSRCGQVYSVDAWIRRRRGLNTWAAIPSWPRHLMILQMIPMMFANGLAKTGKSWRDGDAFYYLINHSWYQPAPMWGVSELFGTNLFRVMTFATHAFEILFPLVVIGLIVRIYRDEKLEPLRGPARWASRGLTVAIGGVILWLADLHWGGQQHLPDYATIALGLCLCLSAPLLALGRRIPDRVLRWIIGRRVWATLLLVFSAQLFFVLEIGWFTGVTMCSTLLLFDGEELGRAPAQTYAPVTGRLRRATITLVSAIHIVAITSTLLPAAKPENQWRTTIQRPATIWVSNTVGWQSWKMFANGPSTPRDLEITLVDEKGIEYPVGDGLLIQDSPDRALDKRHKIAANIIKSRGGSRRAHARWLCRTYSDAVITEVRFEVVVRPTIPPEELARIGVDAAIEWMDARRSTRSLGVVECPVSPP